ncbi:MAG: ABC transporter permease, partial [Anaerolineales bacterium]|nr:ABC transporter permease [Anaerolineales bacterium]
MAKYFIKRVLTAIPVLLVTALLVFSALHLAGGDPVNMVVGSTAPQETRDKARKRLGLDKPLPVQFGIYMGNILTGDLGNSILNRRPVSEMIVEKLPITAELGLAAFTLAYVVAIPLGIIAALNRNSIFDWVSMLIALIGVSMPGFWLGLILIFIFALKLRMLPPTGYGEFKKLILPALALGLPRMGRIARITRSTMLEVIGQDYIRTAR